MIIDSHTHILPESFRVRKDEYLKRDSTFRGLFSSARAMPATADELVAEMERAGVDVSVAVGYGWTDIGVARESNDYLLKSSRAHPGKIVPFCSVNPIWGSEAIDEIERCAEAGAKGIGELHPDSQNFLNSDFISLAPFFDVARSHGLPIMMHTSEPVGHSYPGKGTITPEYSLALAQAFPENVFIFAHFGGGLPFYSLMPEVRSALANVYFDSAAFPFLYRPEVFAASVAAAGEGKILFASDFPIVTQQRSLDEFAESDLPEETKRAVLSDNAARLFNL